MTQDDLVEVKKAMTEVMKDQMKEFYIERERHYLDHGFVTDIREGAEWLKQKTCRGSVWAVIIAIGSFILWSLRHWFAGHFVAK